MKVNATFDDNSANWSVDDEMNEMYLNLQERVFNHRLNSRGYVFLNEILTELDIQTTRVGHTHGWTMFGGGAEVIEFKPVFLKNGDVTLQFETDGDIIDLVYPKQEVGT